MATLKEHIIDAEKKGVAIGHFNVADLKQIDVIVEVAQELQVPVIIGVSEGERDFVGVEEIVAIIIIKKEKTGLPIFLNADHTHSLETAKRAIDAGFDAITADASKLSLAENIDFVKAVVDYSQETGKNIIVEGELGFIGASSDLKEAIPVDVFLDEKSLTSSEDAAELIGKSGADLLAPAVGNLHGLLVSGQPKLNIAKISEIRKAIPVSLVLHGASGNSDDEVQKAIKAGCSIVHINTELRVAFRQGLEQGLENKKSIAFYSYSKPALEEMKKVVYEKLKVFNFL
jgi:fructose-bisphosphate aldolase class II